MDKITCLKKQHIPDVMNIIQEASEHMEANNIPQWDSIYPDRMTFENDIIENTLFGIFVENVLAGVMVLNCFQDKEYQDIKWKLNDNRPLVVHRLCISPKFQGRGLSKYLMHFAEEYARKNDFISIRLDAFKLNPVSVGLYRKLGYNERGSVNFRKGEFFVFEKEV